MSAHIPDGYVICKHCAGLGVIAKDQKTAEHFPRFWDAWPRSERKQDKAACLKKWKDRSYDKIVDAILSDVAVKKKTQRWQQGFIEAPLVYLNNRRWEDGVTPEHAVDIRWKETNAGIDAMAAKLGMYARGNESYRDFAVRIEQRLRGE